MIRIWSDRNAALGDPSLESRILRDQWVKQVISHELGIPEALLSIKRVEGEKPLLFRADQPFGQFSLSHSNDTLLLAWSEALRIGVDLERLRPLVSASRLVERYFSPEELQRYSKAPDDQKEQVALEGWTRHEALFKALGSGVRGMGQALSLKILEEPSVWLARIGGDEFRIEPCPCPSGFLAAIAYDSTASVELRVVSSRQN